jgi:hypothetical protein
MAKTPQIELDKGGAAEEALRLYFQNLGAFVIRGAKVRAGRDEVTDIDLWVYTRASVYVRQIAIVDIKNKRRAKGYERLIWLKGLQSAIGADEAIVATTGTKDDIEPFAKRLGIRLLSSQVFKAIASRYSTPSDRLSSEELAGLWRRVKVDRAKDLAALMDTCLVELSLGLGFAALNVWIDEAAKLLVFVHDHERRPGGAARAALLLAALIAICADYLGRDIAFADNDTRHRFFREGLMFGSSEEGAANRYLAFAEKLTTDFVDRTGATAAGIRAGFQQAIENLPIGPFIDLFSRPTAGRELFDAAMQLEAAAFSRQDPNFVSLPSEAKTILALLVDYAGLDRRKFFRNGPPSRSVGGTDTVPNPGDLASKSSTESSEESQEGDLVAGEKAKRKSGLLL